MDFQILNSFGGKEESSLRYYGQADPFRRLQQRHCLGGSSAGTSASKGRGLGEKLLRRLHHMPLPVDLLVERVVEEGRAGHAAE